MLSKKLTFSLITLILAFALVIAPTTYAHQGSDNFNVTRLRVMNAGDISSNTMTSRYEDISARPGIQAITPGGSDFDLLISFNKNVRSAQLGNYDTADASRLVPADLEWAVYNQDGLPQDINTAANGDVEVRFWDTTTARGSGNDIAGGTEDDVDMDFQLRIATSVGFADGWSLFVRVPGNVVNDADYVELAHRDGEGNIDIHDDKTENSDAGHNIRYGAGGNDKAGYIEIDFVSDDIDAPFVAGIVPLTNEYVAVQNAGAGGITGPFDIEIILSEKPKAFDTSHINATNATVSNVKLIEGDIDPSDYLNETTPFYGGHDYSTFNGGATGINRIDAVTGRNDQEQYVIYRATITPKFDNRNDIVIIINDFEDNVLPTSNKYAPTALDRADAEDTPLDGWNGGPILNEKLVVKVSSSVTTNPVVNHKPTDDRLGANPLLKELPNQYVIPAGGYLVLVSSPSNDDHPNNSGVVASPNKVADRKTAAQMMYASEFGFQLPFPASDLANFFRNGGTLRLLHGNIPLNNTGENGDRNYKGAVRNNDTQYMPGDVIISEIMWGLNGTDTDSQYIELHNTTGADIGIDNNEWVILVGDGPDEMLWNVVDKVSNQSPYFAAPGQNGSTAAGQGQADLISMIRVGQDGTMESSWAASAIPAANLEGTRIGTPGAANSSPMAPAPAPEPEPTTPVAMAGDIMITEIMVDTNDGLLPQWIEIANTTGNTVSLAGWMLDIVNDDASMDQSIDLGGLELGGMQAALIVSGMGRQGDKAIPEARVINKDRMLVSEMKFRATLKPPTGMGDSVGNLIGGWTLPMSAGTSRSSLVRTDDGMGTDMEGWMLAEGMSGQGPTSTYYGSAGDAGSPGINGLYGPLPVELSSFEAKRDRLTGIIEIRWETQSELNNAGFYIKRSETRDGDFTVINATMIAGAGTTAEKQSYTYTDTSAKPNVVYYYQIEDVSLDGDRQTLNAASRLKGHISAAGKATTIWGELKSQE